MTFSFLARLAAMEEAIASCALEGISTSKSALELVLSEMLRENNVKESEIPKLVREILDETRERSS